MFDCCTDAETTGKMGTSLIITFFLDYGVWSFYMGNNANLFLLFGKMMRAMFLIRFFLHLFFLDFFPMLAIPFQYFVVLLW